MNRDRYKVIKGVALPPKRKTARRTGGNTEVYPFNDMELSDCFYISAEDYRDANSWRRKVLSSAIHRRNHGRLPTGFTITTRIVSDDNGDVKVGVWRIK